MASNTELIPEYYFLPELYQNRNRFFSGLRQAAEVAGKPTKMKMMVDSMRMPPWAANSYDLARIMRNELESKHVRDNLHKWIDLIFGND